FPCVFFRIPSGCTFWKTRNPRISQSEGRSKPTVIIKSTTSHNIKELYFTRSVSRWVGKGVIHANAINWVLRETVYHHRFFNIHYFIYGRYNVDYMVELWSWCLVLFNFIRPRNCHWLSSASKMSCH